MTSQEKGFTIVELLTVLALTAALMSIGALAARHYARTRALLGARDAVATQMRHAQQRSFSETYPLVYGVRFEKGTPRWALVRYNAGSGSCTVIGRLELNGAVVGSATDFPEGGPADACRSAAPAAATGEVVFFYPRGTASAGTVAVTSTSLGKTLTVQVNAATGRVDAQ